MLEFHQIRNLGPENIKSIIILVPGTFSRRKGDNTQVVRWFDENSTFIEKIIGETECDVSCLYWDTRNKHESRNNSSVFLAENINNKYSDYEKIFILSHSHGGNISFSAIKNISDNLVPRVELITMATPFITMGTAKMNWYFAGIWYYFPFLSIVTFIYLSKNLVGINIPIYIYCFIYTSLIIYGIFPIYYWISNQKKPSNSATYESSVNYRGDILRNVVPIHIMRSPYDEASFITSLPGFLYSISKLATDICIEVMAAPIVRVMPEKSNETIARKLSRRTLKSLLLFSPILVPGVFYTFINIKDNIFGINISNFIPIIITFIFFILSYLVCILNSMHVVSYSLLGMGQMGLKDADISIDSAPDHEGISEVKTYLTDAGRLSSLRMRHSLYNDATCVSDIISIVKGPPSA